jgi:hypothetical protein
MKKMFAYNPGIPVTLTISLACIVRGRATHKY